MKDKPKSISLPIPTECAIDLADGLDLAELALSCLMYDAPDRKFGELVVGVAEMGITKEDLQSSLSAIGRVKMKLGRELPKHFPELSRAARRGQDQAEQEG